MTTTGPGVIDDSRGSLPEVSGTTTAPQAGGDRETPGHTGETTGHQAEVETGDHPPGTDGGPQQGDAHSPAAGVQGTATDAEVLGPEAAVMIIGPGSRGGLTVGTGDLEASHAQTTSAPGQEAEIGGGQILAKMAPGAVTLENDGPKEGPGAGP